MTTTTLLEQYEALRKRRRVLRRRVFKILKQLPDHLLSQMGTETPYYYTCPSGGPIGRTLCLCTKVHYSWLGSLSDTAVCRVLKSMQKHKLEILALTGEAIDEPIP